MTKEYFDNNVVMAVEIEYEDGHRFWETMKGSEVDEYIKRQKKLGNYLSDVDYSTQQDVPEIAEIINKASKLFWDGSHRFNSFNDAIDSLFEENAKQMPLDVFNKLEGCCLAYDPFTQYIENGAQYASAQRANQKAEERFEELLKPYTVERVHIPSDCTNVCGEQLAERLKSYLTHLNIIVEEPKKRVWTEEEIKNLVQTRDEMLYRSLNQLYNCQTADEQSDLNTKHQNGAGFNALDAEFLTSAAKFYLKTGFLTDKQKVIVRKKLVKYTKQLTRLANA